MKAHRCRTLAASPPSLATPLIFVCLLLALLAACSPHAEALQTGAANTRCETQTRLRFKQGQSYGTPSYLTKKGTSVNVGRNIVLPPIIVEALVVNTQGQEEGLDASLNGVVMEARATELAGTKALRTGGNSVEFNQGQVIFSALVIQEAPEPITKEFVLEFSIPSRNISAISSGVLSFFADPTKHVSEVDGIRFGNYGYFQRAGQFREIPVNTPVPKFWIELVNPFGQLVAAPETTTQQTTTDVTVTVTTSIGTLSVRTTTASSSSSSSSSSPAAFSGKDRIEISGLTYEHPSGASEDDLPQWNFTVTAGGPASKRPRVATNRLNPVVNPLRNKFMAFDTAQSFFKYENIGNTAVLDLPMPPIVINLYDSRMVPDVSNTGLIISATSEQGELQGAKALVVRGVASFNDLSFVNFAPRSAIITFRAGTQDGLPVHDSTIYSGDVAVAVTAIKAKHLSFARDSFVQSSVQRIVQLDSSHNNGGGGSGIVSFVIPSVIIQMKDSAYQIDSNANNIPLLLTVEPQGILTVPESAAQTVMINGIAAYRNLTFHAPATTSAPTSIRIKVRGLDSDARNVLESAVLSLETHPGPSATALADCQAENSPDCIFSLDFGSSLMSAAYQQKQQLYATVGAQIAEMRVVLRDKFGNAAAFPTSLAPDVIAFTSDTPTTEVLLSRENNANRGKRQGAEYVFSCVQFSQRPSGLVRIQFVVVDGNNKDLPFLGIPLLRTGFVTVTQNPELHYSLRFARENSAFVYPNQPGSAVVNIALPTITIEILDSLGQFDDSAGSELEIVAAASTGKLDTSGSRESVVKGRAVFHTLKFNEAADEPVITFTVVASDTTIASHGKSVSTGALTLSVLPIPATELYFERRSDLNVTHELQAFSAPTIGAFIIRAVVILRDSAHQFEPTPAYQVAIEQHSEEAFIRDADVRQSQIILGGGSSTSPCACANFTTELIGYKPGYLGADVYIRYRVMASANPHVNGKELVVGPIKIENQQSKTCVGGGLQSPPVVAEFRIPTDKFAESRADIQTMLASMMGVEVERIEMPLSGARTTSGVDFSTLKRWSGTKADITFGKPLPGSSNRKSSAKLAEEFVALRPGCATSSLQLAAVYYKSVDKDCDTVEFRKALNASSYCALNDQLLTSCQCYERGVMEQWGMKCQEEPSLRDELTDACKQVSTCNQRTIQDVCEKILLSKSVSLIWVYATLGSIGGVTILLGLTKKFKLFMFKTKASLHK